MIKLAKYRIDQIQDLYQQLYTDIFGLWTLDGNCPADVYIGYDEERVVGFVAGYPLSYNTWYLQRAGFLQKEQHKHRNLGRYRESIEIIHAEWPGILTMVDNHDLPALRMDLAAGFIVVGTRQDSAGKLWVELLKMKEY